MEIIVQQGLTVQSRGIPLDSQNGNHYQSSSRTPPYKGESAADKAGSEWRWFEDRVIELHFGRSRRLSRARACPDRSRRGARATQKSHTKKMTEAAKIYWVAGVAHTRRIF